LHHGNTLTPQLCWQLNAHNSYTFSPNTLLIIWKRKNKFCVWWINLVSKETMVKVKREINNFNFSLLNSWDEVVQPRVYI